MEFFAGYGFNKSHSTTYAWVAYQTAYLKANYPRHFMAALLTIEAANTDKLAMYLGECRDLGMPILPPDINASQLAFTVEPAGVRFGLGAVKNVGEGAILSMLGVRKRARADRLALHALRAGRPAAREQAARSRAWSRPARSIRWRSAAEPAVAPRAALRRGRSRHRARRPASARSRQGGRRQLFGGCRRTTRSAGAIPLPDAAAMDRSAAARLREGGARPVHERPSARALQRAI